MPYWRLFYHLVWGTQNREALIHGELETLLHKAICAKAADLGALVYAVGGIEDHIHLVASIPPRIALSEFIGQVKGNSSHLANHRLALPYHFAWQSEYGVLSFGGKGLDTVVKYARNQKEHHLNQNTIRALEIVAEENGPRTDVSP